MSDLIDFFQLEATFNSTTRTTHEIVQTSDRAQLKKEWKREADPIGHGGSGIVWLEHDSEGEQSRVVKQILKGTPTTPLPTDYKRELLALGRLSKRQDLFVHFYGWFESDTSVFLAMEYFQLGDLEKYITSNLTEEDAKKIGRQLLEGLQLLHKYKLAHRDINPANIFVARHAPDWWVKLGDFGISRCICTEQNGGLSQIGTTNYMAPEIFMGNKDEDQERTYTLAVDIWSLGCVLFRLLTRELPFPLGKDLRLYWWSKKLFPTDILVEINVSEDGISLVSEMMKPNPADRLTASNALLHPWTSGQESMSILRLDSYERKTKEEYDDKTPVANSGLQSHPTVALDSGKSFSGNEQSFLDITIPPPAKSRDLASQAIIGPESDDRSTDLPFTEAAALEIPMLNDQKPTSYLSRKDTVMLGDEHPGTLLSVDNLAMSCSELGLAQGVVQLLEQTLEARKRVLGDEHPDTVHSMNNLATSYYKFSQYQEAIQLYGRTIEVRKRILGDEHPDTILSMNNLAMSYAKLGLGRESMQLLEHTLEAQKRVLGDEHPGTLLSMNNLALSYSEFGQNQEAVQLLEHTLEARKRVLGDEHPDTLYSMNHLALSYSKLGQDQKTIHLLEQTITRKRLLGDEDPDTFHSMNNLALSYSKLGQDQKAMQLHKQTLEARKRVLGDEHPDTFHSMNNLALSYSKLGQDQKAMQLHKQTLEARKRVLGDEHSDTLHSMNNLAMSYSKTWSGGDAALRTDN